MGYTCVAVYPGDLLYLDILFSWYSLNGQDNLSGEKMTWKEWCGYSIYKKLWSLIGKRPWTIIYREIWRKYEWFIQMQWFFTGIVIYYFWGWFGVLLFCIFYTYGYINGHFFWSNE